MKTKPTVPSRKRDERPALVAILFLALGLRLWHVDFGLPSLNDPDEPLFVMTALDMLREHRFDPQWFGHPATTLLYVLALIFVAVGLIGGMLGRWHGTHAFVAAVYADPGLAILPMRLFIVACGVGTIWLTYRLGRQAVGVRVGLIAALLLACNPLHVELSQVIRSDMLATVFILWSTLHALAIAQGDPRRGVLRHVAIAAFAAGFGCATKWPAVLVLANPAMAIVWSARPGRWRHTIGLLAVLGCGALAALLLVSPYLVLDYSAVLRDLHGETRPQHLGATGYGLVGNLWWYARRPLLGSFGPGGMALAAIGTGIALIRHRPVAVAVLPGAAIMLLVLATQSLVWQRWALPVLPVTAVLAALAIDTAAAWLGRLRSPDGLRVSTPAALGIALVLLLTPMLVRTVALARMRATDTRQAASAWVRANVPGDRSVLIEQASFDLIGRPGPLVFPLGDAGCIDVHKALGAQPGYAHVDRQRSGRAIVDLGNVAPALLAGCDADVLILSHYARYAREADRFPSQLAIYRQVLMRARVVRTFSPIAGIRGGPEVTVALR